MLRKKFSVKKLIKTKLISIADFFQILFKLINIAIF